MYLYIYQVIIGCECERSKRSPCLVKHHSVKAYKGMEIQHHAFLTSALDSDPWSASGCGWFTPEERASVPTEKESGWAQSSPVL